MHPNEHAAPARGKVSLAAGLVLLAAGLATGPVAAQPRPGRANVNLDSPASIYQSYCSVCHGEKGDGQSMARFVLDPQPVDFTSQETQRALSRAHMVETLNKGARTKEGQATAMVAWKTQLSRAQIEAVVDYVIVRFMGGKVAPADQVHAEGLEHAGHDHSTASIDKVEYPFGLKPSAARGKSIYAANCARCHGAKGDGRGNPALFGPHAPRNFQAADFREFANGFSLFSAVSRGNGHMPAWEQTLGRQEIADVSAYVLNTLVKRRSALPATRTTSSPP